MLTTRGSIRGRGDGVTVGDAEEPVRQALAVRREGNRVWVQMNLPGAARAVA